MPILRIVLDTNGLLRCLSRRSSYAQILEKLFENTYELYVTTPILFEYEEKIAEIFSEETAELILGAFAVLPNVKKVDVHFNLQLVTADADDNKFTDCAFAGNVHFIVTDDKHFNELKAVDFPQLSTLTLDEFKELLISRTYQK